MLAAERKPVWSTRPAAGKAIRAALHEKRKDDHSRNRTRRQGAPARRTAVPRSQDNDPVENPSSPTTSRIRASPHSLCGDNARLKPPPTASTRATLACRLAVEARSRVPALVAGRSSKTKSKHAATASGPSTMTSYDWSGTTPTHSPPSPPSRDNSDIAHTKAGEQRSSYTSAPEAPSHPGGRRAPASKSVGESTKPWRHDFARWRCRRARERPGY